MRLEALLAGIAVVALVATVLLAVLVPGFVADPDPDEPPARLDVAETTLETGEVTGETATFDVTAFVRHHGGPAENVTVVVRAIDDDSNLLADTAEREIGTIEDGSERDVPVSVTVPREGSYVVQTILYADGERVDVARTTVSGVEALTPPHAESTIEFHEFSQRPSVEYTIERVEDDVATLSIHSYLSNTGDDPESDLRLEVTARQSDANVVADRTETTIGAVEPGRTATTEVTLAVPDGYNYYLDATLWRDGVVIDSTRAAANLDPRETIEVEETVEEVEFEAGEFETDPQRDRPPETPEPEAEEQPGFGIALALVALSIALLAARRWST